MPDQDSSVCRWSANPQLRFDVRKLAPCVVSGLLDGHSSLAREQYRSLLAGYAFWNGPTVLPVARCKGDCLAVCRKCSAVCGRPGKSIGVECPDQQDHT